MKCPFRTARSAGRCNSPAARAVFGVLQRPAETATERGHRQPVWMGRPRAVGWPTAPVPLLAWVLP